MMFARLFEQRDEPLDFADGIFVGVGRAFRVVENGVDQNRDRLLHAVENQKLVGDEKIHHGRFQFVVRRARHDGFDVVDEFVADEADRAAGEARQSRHGHRAIFFHHALDDFEAVADGGRGVTPCAPGQALGFAAGRALPAGYLGPQNFPRPSRFR